MKECGDELYISRAIFQISKIKVLTAFSQLTDEFPVKCIECNMYTCIYILINITTRPFSSKIFTNDAITFTQMIENKQKRTLTETMMIYITCVRPNF